MSLTKNQNAYVICQTLLPIFYSLHISLLRYKNKITHSFFLSYWFGILLSLIWQVPEAIAGDSFMQYSFNHPLEGYSHIFTAMINGIIFHTGLYWVHVYNKNRFCGLTQLGLLTLWCLGIQFFSQLIFNNTYWKYTENNRYNMEVFKTGSVHHMAVPYLIWIIFSIWYLTGAYSLADRYGKLYTDYLSNMRASLNTNDSLYTTSTQVIKL